VEGYLKSGRAADILRKEAKKKVEGEGPVGVTQWGKNPARKEKRLSKGVKCRRDQEKKIAFR